MWPDKIFLVRVLIQMLKLSDGQSNWKAVFHLPATVIPKPDGLTRLFTSLLSFSFRQFQIILRCHLSKGGEWVVYLCRIKHYSIIFIPNHPCLGLVEGYFRFFSGISFPGFVFFLSALNPLLFMDTVSLVANWHL